MKKTIITGLLVLSAVTPAFAHHHGGNAFVGGLVGGLLGGLFAPRPVAVVAPAPVVAAPVVAPAPVVAAPTPVVAPAPVVVTTTPVIPAPVVVAPALPPPPPRHWGWGRCRW